MKNLLLKIISLMLCLLALRLGTACTEPAAPAAPPAEDAWKHQVTNTEILETEHFLDAPDSVVYYDRSFENVEELSAEDATALHNAFDGLQIAIRRTMPIHGWYSMGNITEYVQKNGAIEFRYDQRRQYVGPLLHFVDGTDDTKGWDPGAKGAFDAWLIVPMGNKELLLIPYVNGEYCDTVSYTLQYAVLQFGEFRSVWENVFGSVI